MVILGREPGYIGTLRGNRVPAVLLFIEKDGNKWICKQKIEE
jgi:hypothetical protein